MKTSFGARFLSLAIACLCVRGENGEDCKEAHEQRGFRLWKYKYKEIQANSLSECYMNCAKESSCHSVNFLSSATRKCEMNTATRTARPEDYTRCADSIYMENVVRGIVYNTPLKFPYRLGGNTPNSYHCNYIENMRLCTGNWSFDIEMTRGLKKYFKELKNATKNS